MESSFSKYMPLFAHEEARRNGISLSELGETMILTIGNLPPDFKNLMMLQKGVQNAVTENDLEESNRALTKARTELNTIDRFLSQFAEELEENRPELAKVMTQLIEFIINDDDKLADFKTRIKNLFDDKDWQAQQTEVTKEWLNS